MPRFGWSDEPDFLCSGFAEEDLEAWRIELAVWEAMTGGQGGYHPGQNDPPPGLGSE